MGTLPNAGSIVAITPLSSQVAGVKLRRDRMRKGYACLDARVVQVCTIPRTLREEETNDTCILFEPQTL